MTENVDLPPDRPLRVTLLQRVEYLAMRVVMGLASWLPESVGYGLADGLGSLFLRCSPRRQRYALRLLRNAFPDETDEQRLLHYARRGTGNLLKVALDIARLGRFVAHERLEERIDISAVRATGLPPPWIGVTGHLGSWEMAAAGIAMGMGETHCIVRLMKNPLAQRWLRRSRARTGLVLHDRRGGIRGFTRALHRGQVTLQAIDQNQRLRGVYAPFFGEVASTERAAATLAVRRGYPILVGACPRIGRGFRFRIDVEAVIEPAHTGDLESDVRSTVARLNAALEALIRRYPEQYLWIHDRYRTRPSELPVGAPLDAALG